jgi:hypothetical protein
MRFFGSSLDVEICWRNGARVISDFGFRIEKNNLQTRNSFKVPNLHAALPNPQSSYSNTPLLQHSKTDFGDGTWSIEHGVKNITLFPLPLIFAATDNEQIATP